MINEMFDFLDNGRTSFNATDWLSEQFRKLGFIELYENQVFELKKGENYFLNRNGSSLIAFKVGQEIEKPAMHITAAHSDCPGFKLKPNAILKSEKCIKLNTEVYGGPIFSTWLDRPLSMAGRVIVDGENGLEIRHIDFKRPLCLIPSLAIHMNPTANKGFEFNPQVDLLPMCGDEDFDLDVLLAEELKVEKSAIMNFDLYLYPVEKALLWGAKNEFISSHHLDDLAAAYTCFKAFVDSDNSKNISVFACFDNEEVGSLTRQGADSDFLRLTTKRIAQALNIDLESMLSQSMLLSCDNANAAHLNHPEKADQTNRPYLNKGIVVKYNANQSYTSDSLGAAIFTKILKKHDIPYQYYTNRSDMRGGSTLGNLSNAQVSFLSLDIGLAQLAMHSCFETCGSKDVEAMVEGVKAFYNTNFTIENKNIKF